MTVHYTSPLAVAIERIAEKNIVSKVLAGFFYVSSDVGNVQGWMGVATGRGAVSGRGGRNAANPPASRAEWHLVKLTIYMSILATTVISVLKQAPSPSRGTRRA